jgi:hypothetical protein
MWMSEHYYWPWGGIVLFGLVFVLPCWQIVRKAGFSGAWALLAFVPLVNVIALWVFAFSRWPVQRPAA